MTGTDRAHRLAGIIIFLLASGLIGGFAWPYAVNTWIVYLGGQPIWGFLQGFLLGLVPVVGQAGALVALVTWLVMLFLA